MGSRRRIQVFGEFRRGSTDDAVDDGRGEGVVACDDLGDGGVGSDGGVGAVDEDVAGAHGFDVTGLGSRVRSMSVSKRPYAEALVTGIVRPARLGSWQI